MGRKEHFPRSCCAECGRMVISATSASGHRVLLDAKREVDTFAVVTLDIASGDYSFRSEGATHHRMHRCRTADVNYIYLRYRGAVRIPTAAWARDRPIIDMELAEPIFRPLEVACPKCHVPPNERCVDMRRGQEGRQVKHQHETRSWASIHQRGFAVRNLILIRTGNVNIKEHLK